MTYDDYKIEELKRVKEFFEECINSDKENAIAGRFGGCSTFFGNAILHNSFNIPYAAMKLIYKANEKRIADILNKYEKDKLNI
jgi:hypothetical protein